MSDAAITTLVTGLVTITTIVVGWLSLWTKMRYGAKKAEEAAIKAHNVETKIDKNTEMTSRIERRTNGPLDLGLKQIADHDERISALESEVRIIKTSIDGLSSNINSTRHELRGHLQTITSNLSILMMNSRNTRAPLEEDSAKEHK